MKQLREIGYVEDGGDGRVLPPATNIRNDMLQWTPAEKAIHDASQAVEAAGASPLLTDAVNLLAHARQKVAMHVETHTAATVLYRLSPASESTCSGCRDGWPVHIDGEGRPCHYEPGRGNGPTEHFPCLDVPGLILRLQANQVSTEAAPPQRPPGPFKPPRPPSPRAYA